MHDVINRLCYKVAFMLQASGDEADELFWALVDSWAAFI